MERARRQFSNTFFIGVWGVLHAELWSILVDTYFEVEFSIKKVHRSAIAEKKVQSAIAKKKSANCRFQAEKKCNRSLRGKKVQP